jgi:hypothetical protein
MVAESWDKTMGFKRVIACGVCQFGPHITSGKRGFYPPPLVPKLFGPGLKVALVPVRAAGARPAPSPGS